MIIAVFIQWKLKRKVLRLNEGIFFNQIVLSVVSGLLRTLSYVDVNVNSDETLVL